MERNATGGEVEDEQASAELQARLAQAIVADFGHLMAPVVDYDLDDEDEDDDAVKGNGGASKKRKRAATEDEGVTGKHGEEDDRAKRGTGRATGKGGACEGCGAESKYRCPRCDWRSCGVACVRRHKEETGCSGLRDRTAYVPLRAMTDTHLHSDFNFLQDCMRVADVSHLNKPKMNSIISKRFRIFLYQCRRRRVRVQLLPQGMAKRKQNTSYYSIKDDTMLWRVEWRFPCAADSKLFSDRVSETTTLHAALSSALSDPKRGAGEELAQYSQLPAERLCFIMRVERLPANEVKYFRFAGGDTLRSVLEDTELVEFPTLLVLTDDELAQAAYSIVDKKDVRNLQRRAEKGKDQQSGHAGGEPQADLYREAKNEIGAAVAVPPKPEPTPAGAEEDDDEEEGFAFATLVDY